MRTNRAFARSERSGVDGPFRTFISRSTCCGGARHCQNSCICSIPGDLMIAERTKPPVGCETAGPVVSFRPSFAHAEVRGSHALVVNIGNWSSRTHSGLRARRKVGQRRYRDWTLLRSGMNCRFARCNGRRAAAAGRCVPHVSGSGRADTAPTKHPEPAKPTIRAPIARFRPVTDEVGPSGG